MRRPVEGAEKGARRYCRLDAAAAPAGDERPNAAFVAIAFGDDALAKARRERVDFQVRRRAFHAVDETQHMGDGELAKTGGERPLILPAPFVGDGQCREQAVQRPVLAEEEQLLLAAEVVIQVPRREVGGDSDVAHAGGGEAAGAEHAGGGAHDFYAAGLGAFRTTVRRLNHGSILAEPGRG
jgi:hypothetical protein